MIQMFIIFMLLCIVSPTVQETNSTSEPSFITTSHNQVVELRIKRPLNTNYTRKVGERVRLECEFEYPNGYLNPSDLTLYWVKNYQELIQNKRGFAHVIRRNFTSILILKKLESFDSGSYMCIGEIDDNRLNATSETTLIVNSDTTKPKSKSDFEDYFLNDEEDDLSDEFPSLNPTIVENFDDKGFCEPYKGTICAGIIGSNYSIYSTSAQQQEQIEERLRNILPLLSNNNLSKRCSTFAIPSLCLFAFPLCDRQTRQPKQICRFDCKQLQQDICKNEYFNVKSLFESKISDNLQSSNSFLLDCNQLPPSSDSPSDCLPIVSMTIDKLESQISNTFNRDKTNIIPSVIQEPADKKLVNFLYILVPSVSIPFLLLFILLTFCYCRRSEQQLQQNKLMTTGSESSGAQIHPSRMRMSNASLGTKRSGLRAKNGSSKSSVASSVNHIGNNNNNNNINLEMNPFLKNYDHPQPAQVLPAQFNFLPPPPPALQQPMQYQQQSYQPPQFMTQQQFQQPQVVQQQHQQLQHQQMMNNDYNMAVKQFSSNNLRLIHEVGKGRFGSVFVGELIGSIAPTSVVKVVIKTLNQKNQAKNRHLYEDQTQSTPNVNNSDSTITSHIMEQEFNAEIGVYSSLRHRNLANLIGVHYGNEDDDSASVFTENSQSALLPPCMVFEQLNNGDLHEYLLQRSVSNTPQMYNVMGSQSNLSAVSSIGAASSNYLSIQQQQRNIADFLYIGQQIASGMEYLASQNFILKDLATRNILMSDNLTIKISIDLVAQYKECYAKDYYKFQMKNLPVRWMAPEALLYGRYSEHSDVWSFGICLWEIFNYGCQPYSGCTNPEAIEMIRDRQLLLIPDECPQRAYALMLECWHEIPLQRPTFSEILNRLRNWENYYLFNGTSNNVPTMQSNVAQSIIPQQFQMTNSYSSNSQTSKTSNTATTHVNTPPLPNSLPPAITQMAQMTAYYSPSKNMTMTSANVFVSNFNKKPSPPGSTITSSSAQSNPRNYNIEVASNSLRFGQRPNNFFNQPIQMDSHFDL